MQVTAHIQKILNGTIRVEERRSHGTVDIASGEAHALHLTDDSLTLRATQQCRRVIERSRRIGGCRSRSGG